MNPFDIKPCQCPLAEQSMEGVSVRLSNVSGSGFVSVQILADGLVASIN
jgi:hypothetical protein